METRLITDLKPHPINNAIYGSAIDADLMESINTKGLLTPLIITKDNIIISGHSRWSACKELGINEVPVIVSDMTNQLDIEEAVIIANKQRDKTKEQKGREYEHLKKIEETRAKERQSCGQGGVLLRESFPEANSEKGRSSDIAASKLGMSGKTAEKLAVVIEAIDILEANGNQSEADSLKLKLEKSVDGALTIAKANPTVKKAEEEIKDVKVGMFTITEDEHGLFTAKANNPDYRSTFNATNDSIEWAKWSWNPVTGCLHDCPYCYARAIAENDRYKEVFPKQFMPTIHPDRLKAPFQTRIPDARLEEEGIRNVFVCSMADLFGEWIPSEIISRVFEVCRQTPQFNYLFLTKNPTRYLTFFMEQEKEYCFPENCWLGATADTNSRFQEAVKAFSALKQYSDNITFLSCEPMLEGFNTSNIPDDLEYANPSEEPTAFPFNWIIIGGLKNSENSDQQPKWEWVEELLRISRIYGAKVYFKPNLTVRPKEYPQEAV